jgi:hypothetical protein
MFSLVLLTYIHLATAVDWRAVSETTTLSEIWQACILDSFKVH